MVTAESVSEIAAIADAARVSNPFRGLVPYEERDTLFARDSDVDLILGRLWSSRTTVLFAGSGVGKTSFLNAKLLPTLRTMFGGQHVSMPLRWALTDPAQAIAAAREQVEKSGWSRRGSVIVLDQFEEIFQHLSKPQLLRDAGDALAGIVQDEEANVRLLLSIREEFLADLSLFDVFLPGVLTNYYRLGRLTPKHAHLIIENTTKLGGRTTDPKGLGLLLEDLHAAHDAAQGCGRFIDPPYLQIVCRGVWGREQEADGRPFLATYSTGEASVQLKQYCDEKLDSFSWRERKIVAKTIQQLTGPHEAKKPVRISELASQIGEKPTAITQILHYLSQRDIRLLRQWPDQEVFELYHDMYAPMLWKWKTTQERRERKRSRVKTIAAAAAAMWLVIWPVFEWTKSIELLGTPDVSNDSQRDVAAVLDMRNAFAGTMILKPVGDWLWRSYMHRLETLSALIQDADGAIGYRLAAWSLTGDLSLDETNGVPGPAASLAGTVGDLAGATDAAASTERIRIGTNTGALISWNRRTGDRTEVRIVTPETSGEIPVVTPEVSVRNQPPTVVSLSADGSRAAVAWFTKEGARIGIFDAETGLRHQQAFQPQVLDAGSDGASSLPTLAGVRAAFSPNSHQLVVVTGRQAFVFDDARATDRWAIPRPAGEHFTDAVFVSDDTIAVASHQGDDDEVSGARLRDSAISLWNYRSRSPVPLNDLPGTLVLPKDTWLVSNGNGQLLARVNDGWRTVSTDRTVTTERTHPIAVPVPVSRPAIPMAYRSPDLLLSLDPFQRVLISDMRDGDSKRFHTVPLTAQRRFPVALERKITASGAASLSRGEFVTIDDNGTAVRLWKVAADALPAPQKAATQVASPPEESAVGRSVDGTWTARIRGVRLEMSDAGGKLVRTWTIDPGLCPRHIFVNRTGERVVAEFDSGLWYGDTTGDRLTQFSKVAGDVVFGPGPARLTVITMKQRIVIFKALRRVTDGEWSAGVQPSTRLLHSLDESGVVAYSGFWIHRFTEPSSSANFLLPRSAEWPHVVSVLETSPLDVVRPDGSSTDRVFVNGQETPVDFRAEEARTISDLPPFYAWRRLFSGRFKLCGDQALREFNRTTVATGACGWELRSGRRLGARPPQQ